MNFSLLFTLWIITPSFCARDKPEIYIAGLFPISGTRDEGDIGRGVLPAVNLALEHVNSHRTILPHHELKLIHNDTKCDMAVGSKLFFDMMHSQPPKVMLFGGACSQVTAPLAESSIWWNIWQVSYADTNPLLSDRSTYPHFFRTVPSDSDFNPARIGLLRHFNWTRVGTLFQDASRGSSRYAYAHNKLVELLDAAGIEREMESFSSDPKPALTNLKQKDIRVIIGNFDEEMARRVLCSAIKQRMVGAKYVWVLMGDYSDTWWKVHDNAISCDESHFLRGLEGYIATDILPITTSKDITISDMTAQQYKALYRAKRGRGNYSKFHGYAYDGIWVIAKALDTVLKQSNGVFNIDNFRSEKIQGILNETNFRGVTGQVTFSDGDRVGEIVFRQFQGGKLVKIGEYNAMDNKLDLTRGTTIKWKGNGPPRDRTLQERHLQSINLTLYIILCIISAVGIVVATSFLAINIKFSEHSYIKMSSPNMNNMIVIGCLLTYLSVILLGTDGGLVRQQHYPAMCSARTWILSLGFTLSFGGMFSKTWRVHAIFTNVKLSRRVIKDSKLFMILGLLMLVDFIILCSWEISDPVRRQTRELMPEASKEDIEIIPVLEFCVSDYMNYWLAAIFTYKGLLLIFGCFLAWETREVSIPALNDSKYIGMSVYNVVIMCVSGVPISFIIRDQLDASYLIIGLFIIFCTTITLCLVFVPKVIEIKRDPTGDEKRMRATIRKSTLRSTLRKGQAPDTADIHTKIRKLAEENFKFKEQLEKKNQEIEKLLSQLEDDTAIDRKWGSVKDSPAHKTVMALRGNGSVTQRRGSVGTAASERDDESVFSANSITNLWSFDPSRVYIARRQESVDTTITETIELGEIGSRAKVEAALRRVSCDGEDEELPGSDEPMLPPPYDTIVSLTDRDGNPLYNLDYLNGAFLRETAILSDSEGSDTASRRSDSMQALRQQKPVRFLTPQNQSHFTKGLRSSRQTRIPPETSTVQHIPTLSPGEHVPFGLARSRAPGETCLFKRKSSKAKRKVVDVVQQRQLSAEVFVNKTINEDNEKHDSREEKSKIEGSTCTLYVGPNKVPLRIKCEFVEYI